MRRLLVAALLAAAAVPAAAADADADPIVALLRPKLADPAKPFVLVVGLKAKADAGKRLEAAVAECRTATRAEPGNKLYELTRDVDDPTGYTLYERWESLDALAAHLKAGHTKKLLAAFTELTDSETKLRVAVPVAE